MRRLCAMGSTSRYADAAPPEQLRMRAAACAHSRLCGSAVSNIDMRRARSAVLLVPDHLALRLRHCLLYHHFGGCALLLGPHAVCRRLEVLAAWHAVDCAHERGPSLLVPSRNATAGACTMLTSSTSMPFGVARMWIR